MPSYIQEPCLQDLQSRGFIQGITIKDKLSKEPICNYFGGIPYAQPPVGEHRWRKPRELAPCYSYGTRNNPGKFDGKTAICPQPGGMKAEMDENCLQLNVWVPTAKVPERGWPIYFYIHGGFLQFGSANSGSPISLLSLQSNRFMVVKPAYRLNLFGFLSSNDIAKTSNSAGNFGFWDLRLALEWTYKFSSYFGGNPAAITVGGYSAGAHAAFHLLAYDLRQPDQLIRRIIMHSNGSGLQPKSLAETQVQFDELCSALDIPTDLSSAQKLSRLRATSPQTLLATAKTLSKSQFRAVSDDHFVSSSLLSSMRDGSFARTMRVRKIPLFIGECADEHFLYARYRPPQPATRDSVTARLEADYPIRAVRALMALKEEKQRTSPEWSEEFGRLYAALQIHMSQRGVIHALKTGGVEVLRYRIEWRAKCADRQFPKEYGATHGSDNYLWWYGNGDKQGLTKEEELVARRAFLDDFGRFVKGEKVDWGLREMTDVRRLKADGEIEIWKDTLWEKELLAWDIVGKASEIAHKAKI